MQRQLLSTLLYQHLRLLPLDWSYPTALIGSRRTQEREYQSDPVISAYTKGMQDMHAEPRLYEKKGSDLTYSSVPAIKSNTMISKKIIFNM